MAAWPKISRGGGIFEKFSARGGYTKNTPPLFPLPGFKRREKNEEKPMIVLVNYLTIFSYIVCIVKYLAGFRKLSYTTKLILFDVASLLGGIELYNRIFGIFALFLGLAVNILFRCTKSEAHREWTQVFELTRSREPQKLVKDKSQMDDIMKLVKAMKVVYRIWTPLFVILSKTFVEIMLIIYFSICLL